MEEKIKKLWAVKPCPCGHPSCHAVTIEPHIIQPQGAMGMEVAEHIVHIHNLWVIQKMGREVDSPEVMKLLGPGPSIERS